MCLKRLITVLFERSEMFHLLSMIGVSVSSLHVATDSMICMWDNILISFSKSIKETYIHMNMSQCIQTMQIMRSLEYQAIKLLSTCMCTYMHKIYKVDN